MQNPVENYTGHYALQTGTINSIASRCSLSLKRTCGLSKKPSNKVTEKGKENLPNIPNLIRQEPQKLTKDLPIDLPKKILLHEEAPDDDSLRFSFIEDLLTNKDLSAPSLLTNIHYEKSIEIIQNESVKSYKTHSSATEVNATPKSVSTVIYDIDGPTIKVSFGVNECETVDVDVNNGAIKKFSISHKDKCTNVDCEILETSQISTETEVDENMNETSSSPRKRAAVTVSLEIKKQKLTHNDNTENSKVLILNTNAIEKISHVIVQPPNYKFVKRISHKSKYRKEKSSVRNGNLTRGLKQVSLENFFCKGTDATIDVHKKLGCVNDDGSKEMSKKNLGVIDAVKCERSMSSRANRRESNDSPKSARLPSRRELASPKKQDNKGPKSEAPPPKGRNESLSAHSPRKNVEQLQFQLPVKSKSNKTSLSPKNIPHHKIVAGTHFAVDAFSYGDIPNVKHYFLTHFHSDHYSGLKKSFNKLLFCSKITADLCILRLGVSPKNIRIIDVDEVIRIDGVEVAAADANHCPGALMLMFTLLNGKTLLHTGDFRACPSMESYPIFWNKDIHTIYLDTTYCNPRFDFPTQDQSLEMALYILRQKKMALEKVGKKFAKVLIVCGTYTIGKEKFFLGMSRRVGCSVWACPEKERILETVEGQPRNREPPHACQLHVVPMRDLTHEKLRSYLDSLQGAFNEVVAFKPSGWENGKNSSVSKDSVTIHGIPYSEHSSFSELIRFVKFLKPKQVVPTVDISGGVKTVQKYFPCPLVFRDEIHNQSKLTDYFSIHSRQQITAVT